MTTSEGKLIFSSWGFHCWTEFSRLFYLVSYILLCYSTTTETKGNHPIAPRTSPTIPRLRFNNFPHPFEHLAALSADRNPFCLLPADLPVCFHQPHPDTAEVPRRRRQISQTAQTALTRTSLPTPITTERNGENTWSQFLCELRATIYNQGHARLPGCSYRDHMHGGLILLRCTGTEFELE